MTSQWNDDPLILTLRFDTESQAFFDRKRSQHFPADRNHIDAHCTLFHHLPADEEPRVIRTLSRMADEFDPFETRVSGLMFMGFGSAFLLESQRLQQLHLKLAKAFDPWLTKQDRQPFKPHVTFQNKVAADDAKATHASEASAFRPFTATATGLNLWYYRGGPWEEAGGFPFN